MTTRVEQVAEGVWVLQGADRHIRLVRPERDLNHVTGELSVPPSQTIAVLNPQLGTRVQPGELRRVLHRTFEPSSAAARVCRDCLVFVHGDDLPSLDGVDGAAAVRDLRRDRPRLSSVLFAA